MSINEQNSHRLSTLLHLGIELFFAVLPLCLLASVWPRPGEAHPETFLTAPEWSLTACVLYGLALARLQLGASVPRHAGETRPLALTVLGLVPLSGVLCSAILITKFAHGSDSAWMMAVQLLNFLSSVLVFLVIGGYGVRTVSKH